MVCNEKPWAILSDASGPDAVTTRARFVKRSYITTLASDDPDWLL